MFSRPFTREPLPAIRYATFLLALIVTVPCFAQTYSVVATFESNPHSMDSPGTQQIVQGRNGEIYAGTVANGALFSASPLGTLAQVADNGGPQGVALGADGNLYTTVYFDRIGCGEVWKVTPSGTSTQIASICGTYGNGPTSAPVQAPNGLFYGTSSEMPSGGAGTIYSMTPAGTLNLIHQFVYTDGSVPIAPLTVGSDGNLYGGTRNGGISNDGVLFKVTPSGAFTVLHNFSGTDGRDIEHALVLGRDGNLYGVTNNGGPENIGVFFKMTNSGTYTALYNFIVTPYSGPNSSLVQGTDGNFYGLLGQGNGSQPGWIYSLTPSGQFAALYEFCQQSNCTDGIAPSTPLIQHTDGKFYGFTVHGGNQSLCSGDGCGVFFSLDMGLAPFVVLGAPNGKEGAKIGIYGQRFTNATTVSFGGTLATTVARAGSTYLGATVPPEALTGLVTVTTGSTKLTSSQVFKVTPTFVSFSPPSGSVGSQVTITGTGLLQTTKVSFNGTLATFTVNSDTQITTTVPSGATTGRIGLATKGGTAVSAASFTVN